MADPLRIRWKSNWRFNTWSRQISYWTGRKEDRKVSIRGLRKVLPVFYPTFNHWETVALVTQEKKRLKDMGIDPSDMVVTSESKAVPIHRGETKGMSLGSEVDNAVNCIILERNIKLPDGHIGYKTDPRLQGQLEQVGGLFVSSVKLAKVHPLAQKFLLHMLDNNFRPLTAQVTCGLLQQRIGTRVDSIWLHNSTGKIWLVELEAARREYYLKGNDQMTEAYEGILNSGKNKKLLQCFYSLLMLNATFKDQGVQVNDAMVVRVHYDDVEPFVLTDEDNCWVLESDRTVAAIKKFTDLEKQRTGITEHKLAEATRKRRIRKEAEERKKRKRDEVKEEKKAERDREREAKKQEREREREEKKAARQRERDDQKAARARERQEQKRDRQRGRDGDRQRADDDAAAAAAVAAVAAADSGGDTSDSSQDEVHHDPSSHSDDDNDDSRGNGDNDIAAAIIEGGDVVEHASGAESGHDSGSDHDGEPPRKRRRVENEEKAS